MNEPSTLHLWQRKLGFDDEKDWLPETMLDLHNECQRRYEKARGARFFDMTVAQLWSQKAPASRRPMLSWSCAMQATKWLYTKAAW